MGSYVRWVLLLVVCTGCVAGQLMTASSFEQIRVGMSPAEVEELAGKPWELRALPGGMSESIYCERIRFDGVCREEKRYVLLFREGRLVSKRVGVMTSGR